MINHKAHAQDCIGWRRDREGEARRMALALHRALKGWRERPAMRPQRVGELLRGART